MRTIWQFSAGIDNYQTIDMPTGAQILSVQVQGNVDSYATPQLWAVVNPNAEIERRYFRVYGAGSPVDQVGEFIGTFQMYGGSLIYHMFEVESWENDN
jgi:hypothetical protein